MHEYDTWAQWAQTPAGNIAEHNEGISNYIKSLTLNAYISEYGTQDERNDGRTQETAALAFIHMESFAELDELRRETMMTTTTAFAAVKKNGGRGSAGAGSAMRAEKPEKMVPEMQTLELIDELKTRKNGDDMSWDGFNRPNSRDAEITHFYDWGGLPRVFLRKSHPNQPRNKPEQPTGALGAPQHALLHLSGVTSPHTQSTARAKYR